METIGASRAMRFAPAPRAVRHALAPRALRHALAPCAVLLLSACGSDDSTAIAQQPHDGGSSADATAYDGSSANDASVNDTGSSNDGSSNNDASAPGTPFVYIGSAGFSGRQDDSIHVFQLDPQSGALTARGAKVAAGANPSYIAFDPTLHFLYVVNESAKAVASFSIDPQSGALAFLNRVASGGDGPTHVSVDAAGKYVFVANYTSGDATVFARKNDGSIGAIVGSRAFGAGSATHCIRSDAAGKFVLVENKDKNAVAQLVLSANGALSDNTPASVSPAANAGPRHLDFHPNGRFAYVIDENASAIDVYGYDAGTGRLSPLQTITTLPSGFTGANTGAEIQVAPSGRFVYGSNRGDDSIAIFSVDANTGKLTLVGHTKTRGKTPRQFMIDARGRFLLVGNQDSDTVAIFSVDANAGTLTPLGATTSVPSPAYIGLIWLP